MHRERGHGDFLGIEGDRQTEVIRFAGLRIRLGFHAVDAGSILFLGVRLRIKLLHAEHALRGIRESGEEILDLTGVDFLHGRKAVALLRRIEVHDHRRVTLRDALQDLARAVREGVHLVFGEIEPDGRAADHEVEQDHHGEGHSHTDGGKHQGLEFGLFHGLGFQG